MALHNIPRVLPLVLLALGAPVALAGVVKWTDANGVVHFGERAPPGVTASTVRVAPPPPPRPVSQVVQVAAKPQAARPMTISEEREAHSQEVNKANAESLAAMGRFRQETEARNNQAAVDRCNASHDTYCNQGAAAIRQQEYQHDLAQAAAQSQAALRQGVAVPEAQRIKPRSPN